MPLPWSRLKLADKASLARALAQLEELNQALVGVYLKGLGEVVKANKYLAKSTTFAEGIKDTFK